MNKCLHATLVKLFISGGNNQIFQSSKDDADLKNVAPEFSCYGGSLRGVVANVKDYDVIVSEFEPQSCYYVHFRTNFLR